MLLIGYRADKLSRKHYVWVAVIAALGVFYSTETAHEVALMHGNRFEFSPLMAAGAWLYSAAFLCAGLLAGAWIGSRRRLK